MGRRKKAGTARPAIDVKAADLSTLEQRIAGRLAAHGAAYGTGTGTGKILGTDYNAAFHDELVYGTKLDRDEYAVDIDCKGLTDDEWRWAVAFRKVLGVGHEFYEYAPRERRRHLEQHHRELAHNDTPKGRKAAKVVAVYTSYTLERRGMWRREYLAIDYKTGRTTSNDQIDAYNYLFGQMSKRGP